MTKLLAVAHLFAGVLLCGAAPISDSLSHARAFAAETHLFAQSIVQRVHKAQRSRVVGRRLDMMQVDFAKMCTSGCWSGIASSMIAFYTQSEEMNCFSGHDSSTHSRRMSEAEGEESHCMFDMCGSPELASMCGMIEDDPRQYITDSQVDMTSTDFNMTLYVVKMTADMVLDDPCVKASMEMSCHGMCSQSCAADSAEERKMFCSQEEGEQSGGDDHSGTGGDDHSSTGDENEEQEGSPDASEMAAMFNMICLKNPNEGFYCYDKISEDMKNGAWQEDGPADTFPDPCNIDCSGATAQAISGLGCCFASLIDAAHRSGGMSKKEIRAAKAGASKCAPDTAFTMCSGAESGVLVDMSLTTMSVDVPFTCSELAAKEDEFLQALNEEVGSIANLDVLTCQEGSCDGRRLETGGSKVTLLAQTMGSDKDSKASAIQQEVTAQKLNDAFQKAGSDNAPASCIKVQKSVVSAAKAKGFIAKACDK